MGRVGGWVAGECTNKTKPSFNLSLVEVGAKLGNSYIHLVCKKVPPKYDLDSNLWFVNLMVEKMDKKLN